MKHMLSIIFAALLVTGCASGGGETAPSGTLPPVNEAEVGGPPGGAGVGEQAPNGDTAGQEQETGHEEAEHEEAEPEEALPPSPTYRLNANYDVKPIDDSSPDKVVLLTFDDGPKEEAMLLHMLDTLDRHEAKAIFFVNGYRVKSKPELLKLIHERGQYIGNHSWDHVNLKKEAEEEIDRQLEDVQRAVEELTGVQPMFFRPPFGAGNDYVKAKSRELGMLYMTWSNGSLDWDTNKNNPDGVITTVLEQLRPGSNILMHELQWTADALDGLLSKLKEEGYGFVDPGAMDTAPPTDS